MKHMGQDERNRIEFMLGCGNNVAAIAKALGRSESTISRELLNRRIDSDRHYGRSNRLCARFDDCARTAFNGFRDIRRKNAPGCFESCPDFRPPGQLSETVSRRQDALRPVRGGVRRRREEVPRQARHRPHPAGPGDASPVPPRTQVPEVCRQGGPEEKRSDTAEDRLGKARRALARWVSWASRVSRVSRQGASHGIPGLARARASILIGDSRRTVRRPLAGPPQALGGRSPKRAGR